MDVKHKKPTAYLHKPTYLKLFLKIQVTLMLIFNSYENIIVNNEIITCIIKRKQESGFYEWNGGCRCGFKYTPSKLTGRHTDNTLAKKQTKTVNLSTFWQLRCRFSHSFGSIPLCGPCQKLPPLSPPGAVDSQNISPYRRSEAGPDRRSGALLRTEGSRPTKKPKNMTGYYVL